VFLHKEVPFGDRDENAAHLWDQISKNLILGREYASSLNINTVINTTKYSSWVVQTGTQQIQDGGRPHFEKKSKNRHISAMV